MIGSQVGYLDGEGGGSTSSLNLQILNPQPATLNPEASTPENPKLYAPRLARETPNLKPYTPSRFAGFKA